MPFLEVITRYYKRPNLLAANVRSLAEQTDRDYTQVILSDPDGRGIEWSYRNMAAYADKLTGDYIWILDDDDMCIRPSLIEDLKAIVSQHGPDVIMLRMDHKQWGVKPSFSWQQPPQLGDIGCSAYVVKRHIWQHHSRLWLEHGRYQSDYDFISSVFDGGYNVAWYDVVASRVQAISKGQPEPV